MFSGDYLAFDEPRNILSFGWAAPKGHSVVRTPWVWQDKPSEIGGSVELHQLLCCLLRSDLFTICWRLRKEIGCGLWRIC